MRQLRGLALQDRNVGLGLGASPSISSTRVASSSLPVVISRWYSWIESPNHGAC
jgi:hypothetical protein